MKKIVLLLTALCLALAVGLLAGLAATGDTLSRERRDGTLGLLFLTDLKGYDVVLGKPDRHTQLQIKELIEHNGPVRQRSS